MLKKCSCIVCAIIASLLFMSFAAIASLVKSNISMKNICVNDKSENVPVFVEYIQSTGSSSTGTEWIDTGIPIDTSTDELYFHGYMIHFNNRAYFAGDDTGVVILFASWPAIQYGNVKQSAQGVWVSGEGEFFASPTSLWGTMSNGLSFSRNYNVQSIKGTTTFKLWKYKTNYAGQLRIYTFTIKRSGDLILDLRPVRFTNEKGVSEGAMYDLVSGQLFRNAGTGSFIIGPDL